MLSTKRPLCSPPRQLTDSELLGIIANEVASGSKCPEVIEAATRELHGRHAVSDLGTVSKAVRRAQDAGNASAFAEMK